MPPKLTHTRGCGKRTAGGVYLEVPTSKYGQPIEYFLLCPPRRPGFDIPVQGQLPFWMETSHGPVLNLIDWIGEKFYPNICDWIEEAATLGISTKVSIQLADRAAGGDEARSILEALTPESSLFFAHARAHINNIIDYDDPENEFPWSCPKDVENHPDYDNDLDDVPTCVGVYWWDLDGGDPIQMPAGIELAGASRMVQRTLPCGRTYLGRTRPEGVTPQYSPAIFARFPVIRLVVVRGQQGEHLPVRERLNELDLQIPVIEADE